MHCRRQIADRLYEQRPVARAVAAREDAISLLRRRRPKELEVERPRPSGSVYQTCFHQTEVQLRSLRALQTPHRDRQRPHLAGVHTATGAFLVDAIVQVPIPDQRRCPEQAGREQVVKQPRAYIRDHRRIAVRREAAERARQERIIGGAHQHLGTIRHRRGNRRAELRREVATGHGIDGDPIDPPPALAAAALDRLAELKAVDEIIRVDVDDQGALAGRRSCGDELAQRRHKLESRGSRVGQHGDRVEIASDVGSRRFRIETPSQRDRIAAGARDDDIGRHAPAVFNQHAAAAKRRLECARGTHEGGQRRGDQVGRIGGRTDPRLAIGGIARTDCHPLELTPRQRRCHQLERCLYAGRDGRVRGVEPLVDNGRSAKCRQRRSCELVGESMTVTPDDDRTVRGGSEAANIAQGEEARCTWIHDRLAERAWQDQWRGQSGMSGQREPQGDQRPFEAGGIDRSNRQVSQRSQHVDPSHRVEHQTAIGTQQLRQGTHERGPSRGARAERGGRYVRELPQHGGRLGASDLRGQLARRRQPRM